MNELPHRLYFYELKCHSNRIRIHLLSRLHLPLNRVGNGAISKKVPLLPASRTILVIGRNNNFPDDIKPWLMRGQSQHYQVRIGSINAVTLVWIVVGGASLLPDVLHDFVLALPWTVCV